jgi:hypothetical protein
MGKTLPKEATAVAIKTETITVEVIDAANAEEMIKEETITENVETTD